MDDGVPAVALVALVASEAGNNEGRGSCLVDELEERRQQLISDCGVMPKAICLRIQ